MTAGTGVLDLFAHDYMRSALLAGSGIALGAGVIGWFLLLRLQVFAADALGHVAFAGAIGALAYGADPRIGLFVATILVGLALTGLGGRVRAADDVVIGSVFAWVLGLGVYFLHRFATGEHGSDGTASVAYLFGSIYGLHGGQAVTAAVVGVGVAVVLLLCARPLLFASVDAAVAAARGVKTQLLGALFLVLVAVISAQATQAVGGLLLLGLLAAPAGAAHRWTGRPYAGMALAAGLAVVSVWVGLVWSYLAPSVPASFGVVGAASAIYALSIAATMARDRVYVD
jgi:zinc/manganese transport system permease protein